MRAYSKNTMIFACKAWNSSLLLLAISELFNIKIEILDWCGCQLTAE